MLEIDVSALQDGGASLIDRVDAFAEILGLPHPAFEDGEMAAQWLGTALQRLAPYCRLEDKVRASCGTIDEIANDVYGNVYLTDGDNRVYFYGCYPGWGATGDFRKGLFEAQGIEVGDKLTVIGVKATYKDTPQMSNGIYFSHQKPE